ncbi:stage II sporulation protein D [Radiobacillus sp. PE A8.2]|uniref:stage II sporulation protein D n=1 Tax=Radiobacillus sp. PE A8.2 TaxID=3380349 RepID=UPI00388DA33B
MNNWKNRRTTNSWKKPSIIILISLTSIILVIPTLIVVPFIQQGGVERNSVNTEGQETTVEIKPSDSALKVDVYRTKTEEIESVPLENYVARVVASEMPAEFEIEALKAQALAARTYIVNYLTYSPGKAEGGADVNDTVQYQVYKSEEDLHAQWGTEYNWRMNKIQQAVKETVGEIVTYKEEPITPAFFSTSNGYTENSEDYWQNELPYLRSVASPWDEESPEYSDQMIFTLDEVEAKLDISLTNESATEFPIVRTESNRVESITLGGKTFTGREIREDLGLRSSDFTVEQRQEHLIFKTIGYGHGIGMSQYGANGMAKEGKTYKEIVSYYYQGTAVASLTAVVPQLAANN